MISVIIPTYNKLPRLKLALCSLELQTYDKNNFEVIVVNDGSVDGTKEYLQQQSFGFSIKTVHTANGGRSAARNVGIEEATGNILIFIDDDLILSPDFIQNHGAIQKEKPGGLHGKIIDVVSLSYFKDPSLGIFFDHIEEKRTNSILKRRCITTNDILSDFENKIERYKTTSYMEQTIQKILDNEKQRYKWIGMTGGNFSCPKEWIVQLGGFDEKLGKDWGCEDFELGYRLAEKYKFYYSDQCLNYHISHVRQNVNEDLKRAFSYFYKKYENEDILRMCKYLSGEIEFETLFI